MTEYKGIRKNKCERENMYVQNNEKGVRNKERDETIEYEEILKDKGVRKKETYIKQKV